MKSIFEILELDGSSRTSKKTIDIGQCVGNCMARQVQYSSTVSVKYFHYSLIHITHDLPSILLLQNVSQSSFIPRKTENRWGRGCCDYDCKP